MEGAGARLEIIHNLIDVNTPLWHDFEGDGNSRFQGTFHMTEYNFSTLCTYAT